MSKQGLVAAAIWQVFALVGVVAAQNIPMPEKTSVTLTIDREQANTQVAEIMDLLKENGLDDITINSSEAAGISVEILTNSGGNELRELVVLLKEAGADIISVQVAPIKWVDFSFEKLGEFRKEKGAILYVRADWCLTCEHFEANALKDSSFQKLIRRLEIPMMRLDITEYDDKKKQILDELGTIALTPTLFFFSNDEQENPTMVRDLIEPEQLEELIQKKYGTQKKHK